MNDPALNPRSNGETHVDQSTTTSYYVEVMRLNGEWVKTGPRHESLHAARRWAGRLFFAPPVATAESAPRGNPTRLLVHTRHILDVDTWIDS